MNKQEFLHILELSLKSLSEQDKKEILYDYEEHFRIGEESGKSDEELILELGDPNNIANQYKTSKELDNKLATNDENQDKRPIIIPIIAICGLLLFNLIFILGPFIGIAASIIGLFLGAIGIILGGIGIILGTLLMPLFPQYINIPTGISGFAIVFFGIGTVSLGLLFLLGMYYVGKYFCLGTGKYINWNLKIIKG